MQPADIRTVDVVRYGEPLREGGSLPAIVEADDGFLYVLKFRGAGQGKKALVAELIGGEIARAVGLKVPEIVFMNLDKSFSQTEPDQEIQDLLRFSVGLNLGLHYLSGAITFDPVVGEVDPITASKVVLLDSLITNIDRTVRNTNLLNWNRELWLIDHGASLYFHHNWGTWEQQVERSFPMVREHVLLPWAEELNQAEQVFKEFITPSLVKEILEVIPDEWLEEDSDDLSPTDKKNAYHTFLTTRIANMQLLTKEAQDAR
jgi:hypothetical protein